MLIRRLELKDDDPEVAARSRSRQTRKRVKTAHRPRATGCFGSSRSSRSRSSPSSCELGQTTLVLVARRADQWPAWRSWRRTSIRDYVEAARSSCSRNQFGHRRLGPDRRRDSARSRPSACPIAGRRSAATSRDALVHRCRQRPESATGLDLNQTSILRDQLRDRRSSTATRRRRRPRRRSSDARGRGVRGRPRT